VGAINFFHHARGTKPKRSVNQALLAPQDPGKPAGQDQNQDGDHPIYPELTTKSRPSCQNQGANQFTRKTIKLCRHKL
jgi:hypothetical protein